MLSQTSNVPCQIDQLGGLVQVNVGQVWVTFSSFLLAFAFVFGNSIRNIYEAVIFLFIVHPFDVGDALFVNGDCKFPAL